MIFYFNIYLNHSSLLRKRIQKGLSLSPQVLWMSLDLPVWLIVFTCISLIFCLILVLVYLVMLVIVSQVLLSLHSQVFWVCSDISCNILRNILILVWVILFSFLVSLIWQSLIFLLFIVFNYSSEWRSWN